MFVRRNKELAQTVCILILITTLGYSIYLYNSLQLKLKNTEVVSKKYLAQHQSLSNQLQKIYADHARAQGMYEVEKQEHSKTKKDFEAAQKKHSEELEKINSLHFDDKNQMKEENSLLKESKNELERNLDETMHLVAQLKADKQLLENNHEEDLQRLQNQENSNQANSDSLYQLQKEHEDLKHAHEKSQSLNKFLSSRVGLLKNETDIYDKLKEILQSIGADALNLEHSRLLALSQTDRSLLYKHFGSDDDHVELLKNNLQKADKLEAERNELLEQQRLAKEERDRQLLLRQQAQGMNGAVSNAVHEKPTSSSVKVATNTAAVVDAPVVDGGVSDKVVKDAADITNQAQEEQAKKELEQQQLSMQELEKENAEKEKLSQEHKEQVIEEIKKLQSAQQKIAEDQQADLLQLQRHHEPEAADADSEKQVEEGDEKESYADEEERKVQVNGPPVVALDDRDEQGFIGAPNSDDNSEDKAQVEEGYHYEDEEEEDVEDGGEEDNEEYKYNDEGDDNNQDDTFDVKSDDDHVGGADDGKMEEDKVWEPQQAGQAAMAERKNLGLENHDGRDFKKK